MQQLSVPSTSIDTEIPLTPPVINKNQQFSVTAELEEMNVNNDCNHNNDSKEEISDDSDNGKYNGYSGYNEYGKRDRGYYYHKEDTKEKPSQ
ncbi:hypothetical protein GLOIN_2v1763795 [Rhizophagus clarus]|uniref:Uncharacterized protein n=1 Tax=Rhizophagus clarus TaxID=94130 RepID=A0A8H3LYE8_9GLOM|nr:hypothetical protein GLOIN_2v1763795 [Rhizophagus clarus]